MCEQEMSKKELIDLLHYFKQDDRIKIKNHINNHINNQSFIMWVLMKMGMQSDIVKFYITNYTYYINENLLNGDERMLSEYPRFIIREISLVFKLNDENVGIKKKYECSTLDTNTILASKYVYKLQLAHEDIYSIVRQ